MLRISMVIFTNYVVDLTIPKTTHQPNDTLYLHHIHISEDMFSWLNRVCHARHVSSK